MGYLIDLIVCMLFEAVTRKVSDVWDRVLTVFLDYSDRDLEHIFLSVCFLKKQFIYELNALVCLIDLWSLVYGRFWRGFTKSFILPYFYPLVFCLLGRFWLLRELTKPLR